MSRVGTDESPANAPRPARRDIATRRAFLTAAGAFSLGAAGAAHATGAADAEPESEDRPAVSAGSAAGGPVLLGSPVVSGPAPEAMTILQPLQRHGTGFVEVAEGDGAFRRIDDESAGLLPFEELVLKFRLPPLSPGRRVRYRVTARAVGWIPVRQFVHGKIVTGEPERGPEREFRTLDPAADRTSFVVWNDTHENKETLRRLFEMTEARVPDFLLWNGDQTNDVHDPAGMTGQFLRPAGLAIADRWPLAYDDRTRDNRVVSVNRPPMNPQGRYFRNRP